MFSKICQNTRLKDTINFKKTEQINSESPKIECKCLNIDNQGKIAALPLVVELLTSSPKYKATIGLISEIFP